MKVKGARTVQKIEEKWEKDRKNKKKCDEVGGFRGKVWQSWYKKVPCDKNREEKVIQSVRKEERDRREVSTSFSEKKKTLPTNNQQQQKQQQQKRCVN